MPIAVRVAVTPAHRLSARLGELKAFALSESPAPLARDPRWLGVLREGLGHEVYAVEARRQGKLVGYLPLAHVESLLFGRYLVSLPYLNSNGVTAHDDEAAAALVTRAAALADELNARHLELRQERRIDHPALDAALTSKVHMRLTLPESAEALWKRFDPKVRNQIRKGEKHGFVISWGGAELLDPFYDVLAENMRDLGTPVYGRKLFESILQAFPGDAELCVASTGGKPAAAALLLHGPGTTEVPTASSLRALNPSCVNMLMYRRLIERAVGRSQAVFDFGRSTADGPTFKFKKQWGATPSPAVWQYATRGRDPGEMRPDNPKYEKLIRLWRKLPVAVTRAIGPAVVRGIP